MPPSLINFDKKGPENQVINFAWPNIKLVQKVLKQIKWYADFNCTTGTSALTIQTQWIEQSMVQTGSDIDEADVYWNLQ